MAVNQRGEEAFREVYWSGQDLSDADAKEALILLIQHLDLVLVKTNETKHGNTELRLEQN